MAAPSDDPFSAVQHDVQTAWASLSSSLPHLPPIELAKRLTHLETDIADLSEAIAVTRQNRTRFNITDHELTQRENFVSDMRRNIQSLRLKTTSATNLQMRKDVEKANDSFVNDEMRQQEIILDEQDGHLEELASAVERIGVMGRDMHSELEDQGQMLDDMGDEFEGTRHRMRRVHEKLDRFIEETGPKQFCTIVTLVITFFVLTFLVVTT